MRCHPAVLFACFLIACQHSSGQVLVLSYHNTGSSIVTRLINLCGVYLGREDQLVIGKSNKLKWFELRSLTQANDRYLRKYSDTNSSSAWMALDFALPAAEEPNYILDARPIVKMLSIQGQAWALKDPRLMWFAHVWTRQIVDKPVCVFTYKNPYTVATALGKHHAKGGRNTQALHLQQWFRGQVNAMEACLGVPTIVIPTILMQLSVPAAVEMLAAALVQAGIKSAQAPSSSVLQEKVLVHLRTRDTTFAKYTNLTTAEVLSVYAAWQSTHPVLLKPHFLDSLGTSSKGSPDMAPRITPPKTPKGTPEPTASDKVFFLAAAIERVCTQVFSPSSYKEGRFLFDFSTTAQLVLDQYKLLLHAEW